MLNTGGTRYQVSCYATQDQRAVNLDEKTCTCRKWDLTAMPCKHAVAAIWNLAEHGGDGIAERWVDQVYWLETWKKVYECTIAPINGMDLWPQSRCPTTLTPPKHHKQAGRPKKKRKKSAEERAEASQASQVDHGAQPSQASQVDQGGPTIPLTGKLPRKGNIVTCVLCKQSGHNKRSCKKRNRVGSGTQDGGSQVLD